ncbi:MAG: Preprotein translocase subunit SecD [Candidatus Yanofskybacteria bacterium GW2011_GWF1_44_227]|uniref:Protein translocase subunit SecD n=1 Tax=Candidatus Yanofskybacteria bacterium GW2011_GWE2_40_11 TaxID=1619033 RepID=A0A0G0QU25_9BACT|nr:MAG: Preprotein translocase subunit SecD [Candidatus Yanofskybacteria bacterium GW2011_GWE1_40_10]KKR40841.1 MAG: Preprotein translocase subunit SecD [Candidatus Yanofskybacteria bacterium GW2011_GWE2_40_11]KKT15956.1 MAG: Preprotein translocase subunit SecD [Candidatus Yanofskybacteria bacterium GW2011_GWF2_43_596]KKT53530.1 MAG: Preprotein translocase subunit SecD [Candidatus Yanofskybacteria bacterium GW2011_GWF1_44_227]OGN36054.1 MAG: protein-export membrane protein SecD [Candidatus Yano
MKNSYKLIIIIVASLVLFAFVYPQGVNRVIDKFNQKTNLSIYKVFDKPFSLGLDLLGGTHLLYQADLSKIDASGRSDAMQGVRDVIERRVNYFGVAEPVVQVSGADRLIVELAGVSDVKTAIQMIGETPFLEFKEQKINYNEIVTAQQQGKMLDVDPFQSTGLNGRHLTRAQVTFDQTTYASQVSLELNAEGTKLFAEITKRNLGKVVPIYLDGTPISIPTVQSEIPDGKAVITGKFNPQEAKMLATRLNSGALPVPINLISQQTIGSSLGADSLAKSLAAGVWGLILVGLYMIVYYRLPGLVAVAALLVYTLIVLSIYKLLPVTLTLAGISGFIITLGMAVDANVLIFARMREELKAGRTLNQSIHEGFSRAWLSIRDGHVTTLIGAVVLYMFTTSIVKGFALTLGIGVLTSLFTATVISRIFLEIFTGPRFENKKSLF